MREKLQEIILGAGFYETGPVDMAGLRYDPEIRRICEGNSCGNYGKCWACPPAVGTLAECRERVERYDGMLLFTGKFALNNSFDFDGMIHSMAQFKKMVDRLDEALEGVLEDYQLLSNEGCGRCKECTWPEEPCRFPRKLHHSIEGYGFQVSQLAKDAGVRYNNGQNTVTYLGALLYKV